MLCDLQIFSGGVYPPSATSRTISFSSSNSFWYLLFMAQVENEIILGGHRAPFFRKWVRTLLFSTYVWSEWENGDLLAFRQQF